MTNPVSAPANPFESLNVNRAQASANAESADRFLTLLVTQMKNQDPLNPLDNAQVTSQLAQINTVKGLDKLNDAFALLAGQLQAGQALQAASLVGHEVLLDGNKIALPEGGKSGGAVELTAPADNVSITIRNASGAVVRRVEMGAQSAGVSNFDWDGKDDAGNAVAAGSYTFDATVTSAGKTAAGVTLSRATVQGITPGASGFVLSLAGGGTANLADIRSIH